MTKLTPKQLRRYWRDVFRDPAAFTDLARNRIGNWPT